MKILFLEWKSFGTEDIIAAFEELGHAVYRIPFSNQEVHHDDLIEQRLIKSIESYAPDFVFSFNYFPIVSLACKAVQTKYVSWVYDCPYVLLYSYTVINPCNLIFSFDKTLCLEFQQAGISTVHYLPLAANTERLQHLQDFHSFQCSKWKNETDIAFVGSLYTEKHNFYNRLNEHGGISPYTKGYLEGIMSAQKQIYGYNFIQDLLSADIIADMYHVLPLEPDKRTIASREYLFAQYVINRHLTATERIEFLNRIGNVYDYDLYTPDSSVCLPGCHNHGVVDYYEMAPYIYKSAKINLNITLRSIKSGIPLRAFDILGSGGFLLTNYQADFDDCYINGEDYVSYENPDDMMTKISYFLEHETERKEIALNGFQKTSEKHTYINRANVIIQTISSL